MNTISKGSWIDGINSINSKIFMPLMAATFILFNTVINKWMGERIETLQNLIAICILLILACNLLSEPKRVLLPWLRTNYLVIVYFVVRGISLLQSGFEYGVIRTIFFEVFFLIGICMTTLQDNHRIYTSIFIWVELIFSGLSLVLYYTRSFFGAGFENFLTEYTYLDKSGNALMFANPNTAGIMVGFSLVLAVVLYGRSRYSKGFLLFFGIFNAAALLLFGCRSAEAGVLAVMGFAVIQKIFPKLNGKRIAAISLLICIMTLIPIYGLVAYHESKAHLSYTDIEEKADIISSGRYTLWKQCAITQKDDMLFGKGNLALEQKDRKDFMDSLEHRWEYSYRYFQAAELGPHNGYIGMISAAGWLGFGLFMAILMQRIKRAEHLKKGRWHLILVFAFVINCFESLFILNRFFTCFYMMMILETDMEKGQLTDGGKI